LNDEGANELSRLQIERQDITMLTRLRRFFDFSWEEWYNLHNLSHGPVPTFIIRQCLKDKDSNWEGTKFNRETLNQMPL